MLLHACYRWPNACTPELWPFAIKLAVELRNATLGPSSLSPKEIFIGRKSHCRLNDFHSFGCLVFVPQARLQAGHSIPKWEPRSRMAVYLGHSPEHALNVLFVLSTRTSMVSLQFHVDHFTTTQSLKTNVIP
jgi:hypothetical protein